jgi:hypothetical protein
MSQLSQQLRRFAALALILIHLIISILHGRAHDGASVTLNTFGYLYVIVVITVAPLMAAVLLFTRKQRTGALLLALSMCGSFIFGFWYHFLSATNDNVTQLHGAWHATFLWTAIALAGIELSGALVGLWIYRSSSVRSSAFTRPAA